MGGLVVVVLVVLVLVVLDRQTDRQSASTSTTSTSTTSTSTTRLKCLLLGDSTGTFRDCVIHVLRQREAVISRNGKLQRTEPDNHLWQEWL